MEERNERGETLEEFLARYDETKYRRPSNTVDMILLTVLKGKLKVLLVKRKDHPFIHDWAMPGGFVNFDEDLDTAMKRELEEETNLFDSTYFRQLYTFGNADRDPRTRVITTVYLSMTPAENIKMTSAGDDAMDTGWFTIQKITTTTDGHERKSVLMLDEEEKGIQLPEMIKGEVLFENVSFSYQKDQSLIEDFSLEVKPGEKIAIVGPTGSGKSTLINLLMRFYEVDKGNITIDGISIKDMSRQQLRQLFGMVLQETWLQSGTIRENLLLGNPNATDEEIQQVLMKCQLDKMIEKLPQGLETPLQRQGEDFSQGQRQLLSIARVMLSQPSMLILDEATSSIDTRTELKIQQAFQTLMEGKTSFIVAHRLSTIQNADKILVLKDGQVIEQGTHEELIARQGFYQHLYQSQWMSE